MRYIYGASGYYYKCLYINEELDIKLTWEHQDGNTCYIGCNLHFDLVDFCESLGMITNCAINNVSVEIIKESLMGMSSCELVTTLINNILYIRYSKVSKDYDLFYIYNSTKVFNFSLSKQDINCIINRIEKFLTAD